jgi:hypothetical protein
MDREISDEIRKIVQEELAKYRPVCPIQEQQHTKPVTVREAIGWVVVGVVSLLTAIALIRTVYEMIKSAFI